MNVQELERDAEIQLVPSPEAPPELDERIAPETEELSVLPPIEDLAMLLHDDPQARKWVEEALEASDTEAFTKWTTVVNLNGLNNFRSTNGYMTFYGSTGVITQLTNRSDATVGQIVKNPYLYGWFRVETQARYQVLLVTSSAYGPPIGLWWYNASHRWVKVRSFPSQFSSVYSVEYDLSPGTYYLKYVVESGGAKVNSFQVRQLP